MVNMKQTRERDAGATTQIMQQNDDVLSYGDLLQELERKQELNSSIGSSPEKGEERVKGSF